MSRPIYEAVMRMGEEIDLRSRTVRIGGRDNVQPRDIRIDEYMKSEISFMQVKCFLLGMFIVTRNFIASPFLIASWALSPAIRYLVKPLVILV